MQTPQRTAVTGFAVLVTMTALTVATAALTLEASTADLRLLTLLLAISGGVCVVLAVLYSHLYQGRLFGGVRGKLLVAMALAATLIIVNVAFTAYLMFISPHDLTLLALIMLFSVAIALFFALTVAAAFEGSFRTLLAGVERVGAGELDTRVEVRGIDEMAALSRAFNDMAGQLEASVQRQRDLEEARRQLIAAVSHDLRTPLATMRAMVESITDGVVTDAETVDRYHRTMQDEIAYLSRLIDDLFEVSQIDSGTLRLRPEESSVADLVAATLRSLQPQAEQRRLTLAGAIDAPLPPIVMDAARMQRVLYNLVQNALRHTPPDGSVVIRAVEADTEIEISVADTGEGMEAAELPRIFDRFYRGSRARSRDEAGSGLGLTIAKGLVELHGGRIWAASERGRGAVLTFTLPKTARLAVSPPSPS